MRFIEQSARVSQLQLQRLACGLAELRSMLGAQQELRDYAFDRLLPMRLRAASGQFWRRLDVVQRAVTWFQELGVQSVVDTGSRVGNRTLLN